MGDSNYRHVDSFGSVDSVPGSMNSIGLASGESSEWQLAEPGAREGISGSFPQEASVSH